MSYNPVRIILATHNQHKAKEIEEILGGIYPVVTMGELGVAQELKETGETLEDNAAMKAEQLRNILGDEAKGDIILADDTGLFVDALGGAPGVYSARYAGENVTYADNNKKLLKELEGVPEAERTASFKTCFVGIFPEDNYVSVIGEVRGKIAEENRGEGGFGYDPLFIVDGTDKSYAEMSDAEKNACSHRGRSLNRMKQVLSAFFEDNRKFGVKK